ncbi:MAG: pyrroline-5-carboxylate reductase [Actinomycetota bacterium]|nr:pyrroline-5-carboxylate reductase [Actinomycetota bacterium]
MKTRVAVVGCGKMGEIIASGMLRTGLSPGDVVVSDVSEQRVRDAVEKYGFEAAQGNVEAVRNVAVVLLAVKPQDMENVLQEIGGAVTPAQLVISIAVGLPTRFFEERLPPGTPVVRVMPNVAAQVGEGMAGISGGREATREHLDLAERLLSGVGKTVKVAEDYMDAVAAISGSGPAYFALFAEALVEAGVMTGLPRTVAGDLVAQTMLGTAALIRDGGMQPAQVREAVTSPGGTTTMALRELERRGVRAAVLDAIQAAVDRSKMLGGGLFRS